MARIVNMARLESSTCRGRCVPMVFLASAVAASSAFAANDVTFTSIANNAYSAQDTNSCAIDLNNLISFGGFQFAAYYTSTRHLMIARRTTGGATWQTFDSGITVSATD